MGLFKIEKTPPDVVIIDALTDSHNGIQIVETLIQNKSKISIIFIGLIPEKENFLDEIVIGQLSFIDEKIDEKELQQNLNRALNFSHSDDNSFNLRYIAKNDILIKKGDTAHSIYILKKGRLQAFNIESGKKNIIGEISEGEFVGEMAYINNEPRSATVEALVDSELIEIPVGNIDKILFKRPAWSKALMHTLSKRLKFANSKR
jgi:CRP/FNR family transcriptional regulator, cyclic AMP receptor protein